MKLDLSKIWEKDEDLHKCLNSFCHISDIVRGPNFDPEQCNKYLFEQLVFFVKQNKIYFDKIVEQIEVQEKDLGDEEEVKEEVIDGEKQ